MTREIPAYWWCETGHEVDEAVEFCRQHPGKRTLSSCPSCDLPILPLPDGRRPEGCSCGGPLPWHEPLETVGFYGVRP